jgi:hypothetical protein
MRSERDPWRVLQWNHALAAALGPKNALHNCGEANQSHNDLERVSKPLTTYKPINQGEANHANDDNDRHVYEHDKHTAPKWSSSAIPAGA